ncbi:hypothetical protein [Lederbergia lenta]|uniref:Yip1 domain-containing protein n=1 Tax=Lederbergia lenta TaxID=1467 RepID=A0A2X4WIW1_LEDLE|nr:hypothetical protein [Lederbergia lenta]MCM3112018.1 hypothetical protein [Lederbergia lenta]MEC2323190.1 hypothetical protein [Lederbergia lenta]SQI62963.1 Uncharacterised protein [Lederbergia lenta]
MIYQTKIFTGLFRPLRSFFQLEKAETIYGLRRRITFLFIVSAIVFMISGWFGLGTHVISPLFSGNTEAQYEGLKSFFIVGRFLLGLFYAGVILYFPALWFWMMTDTYYSKLVVMQVLVLPILLLEQVSFILLAIGLDLPWYSSPLSLGIIAQYIFSHTYFSFLFGCISIFKVWMMVIQFKGLRTLTAKSPVAIISMIISIHLIFWVITAFFAYINFQIFL